MKYQFTFNMFQKLWFPLQQTNRSVRLDSVVPVDRIEYWNKHLKDKYQLDYIESNDVNEDAFYGAIIGDEKHITYFLLQL